MAEQKLPPTPEPESDSRIVHYAYAYQMLPMLVFSRHNLAIWEQMRNPDSRKDTLLDAWKRTCRHFDVENFTPEGLDGEFIRTEHKEYLVITMPKPKKSPEAYRCVVQKDIGEDKFRYFSAEYSFGMDEKQQVVLGEWLAPMQRRNLGYLPTPEADDMLVAIAALATGSLS